MKNKILIGTTIGAEILIIICNVYSLMAKSNMAVAIIELICALWVMLFTIANNRSRRRNKKKNK